jgi:BarA-like signal transduction histidine kinase
VDEQTPVTVDYESTYAEILRVAHIIILDEVSVQHKNVVMYIDRLMRAVCAADHRNGDRIFGGKVFC